MRRKRIFIKRNSNRFYYVIAGITAIIFIAVAVFCFFSGNGKTLNSNNQGNKVNAGPPAVFKRISTVINKKPQIINILEIDSNRKDVEIKPILSRDEVFGYEKTSLMLSRKKAFAGTNGSFYNTYGQPSGLVIIDGKLVTSGEGYPVFYTDVNGKAYLKKLKTEITVEVGGKKLRLDNMNRTPGKNTAVILTEDFGLSTRISRKAINIIIEGDTIKKIISSKAPVTIPEKTKVIVATGSKIALFSELKVGQRINLKILFDSGLSVKNAIECGSWILRNETIVVKNFEPWIGSTKTREPRTAIGLKPDGKIIIIAVDGRQPKKSIGFTGKELAEFLKSIGVTDACFLDGGGSTTMWVNGKLVNVPSYQTGERKVGNALGIFSKTFPVK